MFGEQLNMFERLDYIVKDSARTEDIEAVNNLDIVEFEDIFEEILLVGEDLV